MANTRQLTAEELQEYRDLFNAFDRRRTGSVTMADLLAVSQQLGLPSNQADLDKLLAHANVNASQGHVDFDAFASLMSRSRARNAEEAKRREEHEMRQAFKVFDHDGNGLIDEKELTTTMKNLGEECTKSDIKAMIKAADKNGDGKIDYEEFIRMMYNK